jgi:hypothetical protein
MINLTDLPSKETASAPTGMAVTRSATHAMDEISKRIISFPRITLLFSA